MTTESPIPQSPVERPGRSLLIGATLLAVATALAAWQETKAAEQPSPSPSIAVIGVESAVQKERPPRQILLDVRVVTMKPRDRSKLGTWQKVTLRDDESAVSPATHARRDKERKPIEAQVLSAPDSASTESLLAGMKALEKDRRLHTTANQEAIMRDGSEVLLRTADEDWFFMAGPRPDDHSSACGSETWVCPGISMTAHVNDTSSITVVMAFEVSNRCQIRHRNHPDSEIVTQRSQTYALTLKDGATMAWAGLVQCDPKEERHSSLGRVPLVGGLFRKHQAAKRTRRP